jgi:hypothetical protein
MTIATDPRKTGINAGMTLLAASGVAVALTGTTNETAMATISIPAGAMGLNGGVMVKSVWSYTNSANAKTIRGRLGGIAGTTFLSFGATVTSAMSDMQRRFRNRGSASSQICSLPVGSFTNGGSTSAPATMAIDTAATQDVVLSGQLASAAETITLESYEVWLLP